MLRRIECIDAAHVAAGLKAGQDTTVREYAAAKALNHACLFGWGDEIKSS